MKQEYRLKAIVFGLDFRRTELTNYLEYRASKAFQGDLGSRECYLFVSRGLNQLIWVLDYRQEGDAGQMLIDSRRWRITSGVWSPELLGDYAAEAGIKLVGIRSFRKLYENWREQKAA